MRTEKGRVELKIARRRVEGKARNFGEAMVRM